MATRLRDITAPMRHACSSVGPAGRAESPGTQWRLSSGADARRLATGCEGSICQDAAHPGHVLSIPNLITLARILSVPVMVWAIAAEEPLLAFALFVAAGISDAVDGFLAKRFGMASELGAYLDPLADKTLLVSIYVALGITGAVPRWLVILVVSRDLMIVGGVMLSWLVGKPVTVKPLFVSKLNTAAQIIFAGLVLASLGFRFEVGPALSVAMLVVAVLTLLSVGAYVREWVRHMGSSETQL
jgi:cardiolipin synthase